MKLWEKVALGVALVLALTLQTLKRKKKIVAKSDESLDIGL